MTGRVALALSLAAALVGCGSGEESSAPVDKSTAAAKSGPVTKPSGTRMDVGSEQATANEAKGG